MHILWRRILVSCLAAAFLAGTIAVAYASGIDPCDRIAQREAGHAHHHHHSGNAADTQSCFTCPCCLSLSALDADPLPPAAPQQVDYVTYADRIAYLIGRSVAPDILPPRSIA
jgi:hypothetical protein